MPSPRIRSQAMRVFPVRGNEFKFSVKTFLGRRVIPRSCGEQFLRALLASANNSGIAISPRCGFALPCAGSERAPGPLGRTPWRALADRIVFPRDEPLMPIQESAWGTQSGNPFEVFEADLLGLGCQPSALCIVEPGFLAQLFVEDFHLFLKILDHVLLVAVDPTGQAYHKELKLIHPCIL